MGFAVYTVGNVESWQDFKQAFFFFFGRTMWHAGS